MANVDPWAKYPEVQPDQTQNVQGTTPNDPWAKYPETSQEPTFFEKARDVVTQAGSAIVNPIGAGLEAANQIPGVERAIPDILVNGTSITPGINDAARGTAKGLYNAVQHTGQLGADIQDFVIPGNATPISNALNTVMPEAKYNGTMESIPGHITEVGAGFLAGNKLAALAGAEGLGANAVAKLNKFLPEVAQSITKSLGAIFDSATQGVVGATATSAPTNSGLVVGKDALTHLGLGKILDGLPVDSPDAAQNAIAARVNMMMDGIITGAGITGGLKILRGFYDIAPGPWVVENIAPMWSDLARKKKFFEEMATELSKVHGTEDPEIQQTILDRLSKFVRASFKDLATGESKHVLKTDFGTPAVGEGGIVSTPLDTATSIRNQMKTNELGNIPGKTAEETAAIDQGILRTVEAKGKQISQKGYETTARKREGVSTDLGNALTQTETALGGPGVMEAGAKDVQRLGTAEVGAAKVAKEGERSTAIGTANQITEEVGQADQFFKDKLKDLSDKINPKSGYDAKSFNTIVEDNIDHLPKDVQKIIDNSDGSFKYLFTRVRPQLSRAMKALATSNTKVDRDAYTAMQMLKDNIDKDQMDFLRRTMRGPVANAAEDVLKYYETHVAPYRQGTIEDILQAQKKAGLKTDEALQNSRTALEKMMKDNPEHPEYLTRLQDLLRIERGKPELLDRWVQARDKIAELDKMEQEVYGNKLEEFFNQASPYRGTPNPSGADSFMKMLDDPQSQDRIKYIVDLAKKDGSPEVQKALEYTYARKIRERIRTGFSTELGSEQTSAQGVRKILDNDSFLNIGREIFKDNPKFMSAAEDMLTLANDIQRAGYLRPAPIGEAGTITEKIQQGFKRAIAPIAGPLSHRGYLARTYLGALIETVGPQGAVDRLADGLLADPLVYAAAYDEFINPGASLKVGEKSVKILVNAWMHNDGERKKFNEAVKKLKPQEQTKESMYINSPSVKVGPRTKPEPKPENDNRRIRPA